MSSSSCITVDYVDRVETVTIRDRTIDISVDGVTIPVHYIEAEPLGEFQKPPRSVLLLHGMAFTANTWLEIRTLPLLGAIGLRAIAVDLPGYGKTKRPVTSEDLSRNNKRDFIRDLTTKLGLDRPVIISPSMSGSFSLPYLLDDPRVSHTLCSAYIPIAPVQTETFPAEVYKEAASLRVLIVYGSKDTKIGKISLPNLKQFPRHKVICFEEAGHACYMNQPEKWNQILVDFFKESDPSPESI